MLVKWIVALGVAALLAGALAAYYWFGLAAGAIEHFAAEPRGISLALLGCAVLTTLHVSTRWLRWHYLLRRFTHSVAVRNSWRFYLATVPLLLTPFGLGELLRVVYLRKVSSVRTGQLVAVWVAERTLDLLSLLVFWSIESGSAALAGSTAGLLLGALVAARFIGPSWKRSLGLAWSLTFVSLMTWGLLILALHVSSSFLTEGVTLSRSAHAFAGGTATGGLSGIPLGGGVASSVIIIQLAESGVAEGQAVVVAAVFRIGTVWFAMGIGVVSLLVWREELRTTMRRQQKHFDELAEEYGSLIPEHVKGRLLQRKTGAMVDSLQRQKIGPGARGLDVGCGQGPYAVELARSGFCMTGIDDSAGQVEKARLQSEGITPAIAFATGSATELLFEDASFDFAYAINVLHHVPGAEARQKVLSEIFRVLKPGGVFFLHEMNTFNPLFAFYMGYVFPMLRKIDDGTEEWILPSELPPIEGQSWSEQIEYFTFLPEFIPPWLLRRFTALERFLETSRLRRYSAHFMATAVKRGP